jgi:hypothetical protein
MLMASVNDDNLDFAYIASVIEMLTLKKKSNAANVSGSAAFWIVSINCIPADRRKFHRLSEL